MKASLFLVVLGALVFGASNAPAQTPSFEGSITISTVMSMMGNAKSETKVFVKGARSYVETTSPHGTMRAYINLDSQSVVTVNGERAMSVKLMRNNDTTGVIKFTPTGKTQTINGFETEEFSGSDGRGSFDVWAASHLPAGQQSAIVNAMQPHSNVGASQSFAALAALGYAPIRATLSINGRTIRTMEIEKIEPGKIDDAVITVPANVTFQGVGSPRPLQSNPGSKSY